MNLRQIYLLIVFISVRLFFPIIAYSQSMPPDSITNPNYIKKLITYNKVYPFLNYNQNFIEWCNYSAIEPFFNKLKQTQTRKLKILHIGDSHVQADFISGFMRNQFQKLLGYGGRGFVSPYAAAGTHSAYDYKTSCTGAWFFSRNIQYRPVFDMGLTGATVYTQDSSASFKFIFYFYSIKDNFTRLKIYLKQSPGSFNLKLKASGQKDTIHINCDTQNGLPYVEVNLAKASDTLEFFVNRTDTCQHSLECYGMMIESPEDKGVLYNSVGINGAGYKSILRERLFAEQLKELQPDLLILDLGGNDFNIGKIYVDDMKKDLSRIIDIIKDVSPETSIMVTNCQDAYKRRRNVPECMIFAELTKEVALQKNCVFYNYYNVSGNRFSMLKWGSSMLAQRDRVHLTNAGYYVKGELYLNAILNSYYESLTRKKIDTLLVSKIDTSQIRAIFNNTQTSGVVVNVVGRDTSLKQVPVTNNIQKPYTQPITESVSKTYYTIKPGDNLGSIAQKFHVSVTQLKQWNNIKGTNIIAGKTLVIYTKKYYYVSPTQTNNNANNKVIPANQNNINSVKNLSNTASKNKQIKHKVVSGDSLWTISKKYKVSVDQIKRLNHLKSDNLKIGMVLIITN